MPRNPPASKAVDPIIRYLHADWAEAAMMASVMKGQRAALWPAVAVVVVLAATCYPHVPRWELALMVVVSMVVTVVRLRFVQGYERLAKTDRIDVQLSYLHRYRGFWILNGVAWGMWPLLFYGRLPAAATVACWMLTAGVGGVAIASMSAHLRATRAFLMSFLLSLAISVGLAFVVRPHALLQQADYWVPVLLGLYWLLLLRIVRHLHELYRSSIDLSYHNARLIYSLQEQTRVAQEASRFKDRFLAGAAHDLKQPVSALSIYAEWLSSEPELVDELGPKILQSTQAINALFDSLFDLVKLDAGRLETDMQTLQVRALLDDLEVQFEPMATQKGLQLRVRAIDAALVSDRIMLRRIVGNLVANAIRYTAQGGVLLTARQRGQAVSFEVSDTGIGIPDHEQSQIYEEFYKVPTSGTEEGVGLGLAIVRRLSERLGYKVSLRSRAGRGTVFRVLVPPLPAPNPSLRNSAARSSGQSAGSASGS